MKVEVNVIPDLINTIPVIMATVILYFVFRHFLWDKVKKMMDKRSEVISSNLIESEKAKDETLALKKEYEDKLQAAKEEASNIIANARTYSDEMKSKAIKESKEEAKLEYDKGVAALELERKRVMTSVNDEIVDMAILAASKVLAEKSGLDTDKEMVKSFVSSLEEANE